jgi:hypothetical protein
MPWPAEEPVLNQFDLDKAELGWLVAMGLWLENRTSAPRIIGWTDPMRRVL